jgi:hypothetical protein
MSHKIALEFARLQGQLERHCLQPMEDSMDCATVEAGGSAGLLSEIQLKSAEAARIADAADACALTGSVPKGVAVD